MQNLDPNPFVEFQKWLALAHTTRMPYPNAVALATATLSGKPSVRMMLLKGVDEIGFVFFTHYESRKSKELDQNNNAALLFYWPDLGKQVRIEGTVQKTTREESVAYWKTRPFESQLSGTISPQSAVIPSKKPLEEKIKQLVAQIATQILPCPKNWGGYRLVPESFEFWTEGPFRLHDRHCYRRQQDHWKIIRLAP